MNAETQRIAIAEACGYKRHPRRKCWAHAGSMLYTVEALPDYLNDLNAMHEAEKVLGGTLFWVWLEHLKQIVPDYNRSLDQRFLWRATAAQRAEAFLRTIEKWVKQ